MKQSYYSANEHELDQLADVSIKLPDPKYEEDCPKCKKKASDDLEWVDEEQRAAGVRGTIWYNYRAFPKHCSNGHWWEPNSPKVYTEDKMRDRMLTKLDAGNPIAKIHPGHYDGEKWVETKADTEYFERNAWKAVSLTREEYFGAEVYNQHLVRTALSKLEETRKKARRLAAYAKKVAATLKNKPKGAKGKKKTKKT